jgi:hypothetical protein
MALQRHHIPEDNARPARSLRKRSFAAMLSSGAKFRFLTVNLVEATNRFPISDTSTRRRNPRFFRKKLEMAMRKRILIAVVVPLIAALTAQVAAASEYHHKRTKARAVASEQIRNSNAYAAPADISGQSALSNLDESAMSSGLAGH